MALAPKAAERLAKIAGLLGSDQPGEVCNAASAATKILREHGMTWEALVLRPSAAVSAPPSPSPTTWQAAVTALPNALRCPSALFLSRFSCPAWIRVGVGS
jgi:hypothetical protein